MTTAKATRKIEKRDFYRINDRIALQIECVDADAKDAMVEQFPGLRSAFLLTNTFITPNETQSFELREIKQKYPDVGHYLSHLENRLSQLAKFVAHLNDSFPTWPTHQVNISGNGIKFIQAEPLQKNQSLLLSFALFPDLTRIMTLATVVHCRPSEETGDFCISATFNHILEKDRELLIKHINAVQMQNLRTQ